MSGDNGGMVAMARFKVQGDRTTDKSFLTVSRSSGCLTMNGGVKKTMEVNTY